MSIARLLEQLESEPIHTWFDLGLFIDRFRESRREPATRFDGDSEAFRRHIAAGVAFVTFSYSIDGVTMEVMKYAKAVRSLLGEVPIHLVAGRIDPQARILFDASWKERVIEGLDGFPHWPLYRAFFGSRLERGSELYNELIGAFWRDVLDITERLGRYLEDNDIRLLFLVNTNSNPGNVALALANVLVSEALGIPVICNNHDFYWEGGASEAERRARNAGSGPRDHFFTNAHLGEFFSIIQIIYPWESRTWLSVNINHGQSERLVGTMGHNPANVAEICTAVDTERRPGRRSTRRRRAMRQIADLLSGHGERVEVRAVGDVLRGDSLCRPRGEPLLVGWRRGQVDFTSHNMVLLQPTRIIARKRIEANLELIERLFEQSEFAGYFHANDDLKLTLMVTGPVACDNEAYLDELLRALARMLEQLDIDFRRRVHLALLFSAFDFPSFKARYEQPIDMVDIYDVASMVLLPSETEGRGLPIIEAAAYGVPICARRYYPEEVYAEVVGEHLCAEERLRVIETTGSPIEQRVVAAVARSLLSLPRADDDVAHNRKAVEKRYGYDALQRTIEGLLEQLRLQMRSVDEPRTLAAEALGEFSALVAGHEKALGKIMNTANRQYLPGYGKMAFMIYLKSLIDPSFFRVEQQQIRARAMGFARRLMVATSAVEEVPAERLHLFYNSVDSLFGHRAGQASIRHDHSLAYRHRNTHHYPYHDLTPQELTGVINILHHRVISLRPAAAPAHDPPRAFTDWRGKVAQLCGSANLAIDHRDELAHKLGENVPLVYFTGRAILQELELLVLHAIRVRLGLNADEELGDRHLDRGPDLAPVFVLKRKAPLGHHLTADTLKDLIFRHGSEELKLLLGHGVCRIVETDQISQGIDFRQLGDHALEILSEVRERKGFIVAANRHAAMMTDIVDLDRFHLGRAASPLEAHIMGIPQGSGYVQWVPAGLRFTLAYPTPVQTAADFSRALLSERYRERCRRLGEEEVLLRLKRHAEERGTPIEEVLEQMDEEPEAERSVTYSSINGLYEDGLPWAGVIATVATSAREMQFRIVTSDDRPQPVPQFVEEFNRNTGHEAQIAWNGGYILNAELVGKLGIPELYIGSPLGLVISDGRLLCPPLFNKPAFLVHRDGRLEIKRVSCAQGITLRASGHQVAMGVAQRNPPAPGADPVFYDLMSTLEVIPGDGRVICQLAGNRLMAVHRTRQGESVRPLPVGLTLSFPPERYPDSWDVGQVLEIQMHGWPQLSQAIEAGPLLLDDGRVCIDMEKEGWKTDNSIRTQAARLDYTDMRGPKIAVGLDATGGIAVLAINGRIRESVGATHGDMAHILESHGIVTAMGFDPGGSSTLVVGDRTLNVSPYNHGYESNIYALPPEPRAVASAVIGY